MKIEIMMPFFGDIEHFKRAVTSICDQTDPDWRLTIIDDGYPSELPEEFIRQLGDSRILYLRNPKNLGVTGNFRKCVDLARADFVTIMGCDDLLLPEYVQRIRAIIQANPKVAYIQPGVTIVDENGSPYFPLGDRVKRKLRDGFSPPALSSGQSLTVSLLKGCWTYFPSISWNTLELKKRNFREDYRIVLDLALQLDLISNGAEVFIDDVETFAYRRHRESVSMESALNGERFDEEYQLFTEYSKLANQLGWLQASRAAKVHITSRLNALAELPTALITGHIKGAGILIKHIFRW